MIGIDYPNEQKMYCPACGTLTLSLEAGFKMNECPHLEFLGSDEGPEFERNELYAQWEEHRYDDDAHFIEYLRKTWDDHYVFFTQSTPSPGGLAGYTIFKFPLD